MKKITILIFFIIILIECGNCFAAPSTYYPKNYIITITGVSKDEIKKVELLYETQYGFQYTTDEKNRYWITYTNFGYKYKDYTDEEIIPKLSTQEIDEIAKAERSQHNADVGTIEGYWRETIYPNNITKYAICKDAKIEYLEDKIKLSYTRKEDEYSFVIRIEKNDGSIVYSNNLFSKLSLTMGEEASIKQHEKAREIIDKTAFFEGEYKRIRYGIEEIVNEETENIIDEVYEGHHNEIMVRKISRIIIPIIILLYIIFILKRRSKK